MKVVAALLSVVMISGCAPAPQPAKGPTWEQRAQDATKLPDYVSKSSQPAGSIVAIEKGSPAPFPGILLTEARAQDAAALRVAYEELYTISGVNQRLYVLTAKVTDSELAQADATIKALQPTWFERHSLAIGFIAGFLVMGLTTVGILASTNAVK